MGAQILALPDPLKHLSAEQRHRFDWILSELATLFRKYIKPGQLEFRAMPLGNEHVLQGFTTYFLIDSNIVSSQVEVHKRLAAMLGSDYECWEPCQCPRRLLVNSMTDALSRQKAGPSRERIWHNVMAEYMLASRPQTNLPLYTSTANSPAVSQPNTAPGSTPPVVNTSVRSAATHEDSCERPTASAGHGQVSIWLVSALVVGPTGAASRQQGSQDGGLHVGGSVSRPQAFEVVQGDTPVMPGVQDHVLFHDGIQAALAAMLKHSAGEDCTPDFIRSCNHPSASEAANTVTVRLFPAQSKNSLRSSNNVEILLKGYHAAVVPSRSFDLTIWSEAKSDTVQHLYHLLERLHELFLPGVAPVNLYYEAADGCIAFNRGNKLWYNAQKSSLYSDYL